LNLTQTTIITLMKMSTNITVDLTNIYVDCQLN